ncbi:hypothetical protein F4782DRAFT_525018 [Xylaria castorea]|nr:hypothetical protein F4782DRAFT_525018 [Xylaria castorea]
MPVVATEPADAMLIRVMVQNRKKFYLWTIRATSVELVESVAERVLIVRDELLGYMGLFRGIGTSETHAPLEVNIEVREPYPETNCPSLLDEHGIMHPGISTRASSECLSPSSARQSEAKRHSVLLFGNPSPNLTVVLVSALTRSIAYSLATTAGVVGIVGFLVALPTWVIVEEERIKLRLS